MITPSVASPLQCNLEEPSRFLLALDSQGVFTFQTFAEGSNVAALRPLILHGTLQEHAPRLVSENQQGVGIFVMVNQGDGQGRKAGNVVSIRALFVDLDGAPLDPVLVCGVKPQIVVESSPGRFHAYWLVADVPLDQFTTLQSALAARFHGDPSVKDLPRVMRLPGFYHHKGAPFMTRIIEIDERAPYPLALFLNELQLQPPPAVAALGCNLPAPANAPIPAGQRNSTLLAKAAHWRSNGLAQSEIEALLLSWNQTHCQPPLEDEEVLIVARRYEEATIDESQWEPPQPLPDALPPAPPFDPDALLPVTLAPWVKDVADRMQCPTDYLGVAVIVACGSLIGSRLGVRPKRVDTWHEVPNLWGVIIGPSGDKKTPAVMEMLKPLRDLQDSANARHAEEMSHHRLAQAQHKANLERCKRDATKGKHTLSLADLEEPVTPAERRYMVNDATVEALGIILQGNPTGTLAFLDEIAGLLSKLDQEERRQERAFYLEGYNGKNSFGVDRVTRERVTIPRVCLSILGTTQPDTLKAYLRHTVRGGTGNDGLMQRFQLAVYPERLKGAVLIVDRAPDMPAQDQARLVFIHLDTFDPLTLGADTTSPIPTLGFSEEAAPVVMQFLHDMENVMRFPDLHAALVSHYSKFRKTIPTLALIIHLAENGTGPISLSAFQKALAWMRYLRGHARRVYASVNKGHIEAASQLARKLVGGKLADGFTARDITRKGWTGLTEAEEVKEALDLLADLKWLRATEERTQGRPTVRFWLNPRVKEAGDAK